VVIQNLLDEFKNLTNVHWDSSNEGDYKEANKAYKKIIIILKKLRENNALNELLPLLQESSIGVRLFSTTYLLPLYEKEALKTLKEIANLESNTIIKEWEEGNLDLTNVYGIIPN